MPQPQQPRTPRLTISLSALAADERQIQVRATLLKNGSAAPNIEVLFSVNGVQKIGAPKRTDGFGAVTDTLATPPDAQSVQIQAEAQGVTKAITVPIQRTGEATRRTDQPEVHLNIEDTPLGPGRYRQDLVVANPRGRCVAAKVQITSTTPIRVDGQPPSDVVTVDVPADGRSILVEFDGPSIKPDYRVLGYEFGIRNHELKGRNEPLPPKATDSVLKHFMGKWK